MHQRTRFRLYDKGILDGVTAFGWPTPPDVLVDTQDQSCARLMLIALDALRDAFLASEEIPSKLKIVFNLPYQPKSGWGWGRILTQDLSEKGYSHAQLPIGVIDLELNHVCQKLSALAPSGTSSMMIEGHVASLTQHGRLALRKRRADLLFLRKTS
jgi:hypothetical protein